MFMFMRPILRSIACTSLKTVHFSILRVSPAVQATSLHTLRYYCVTNTRMAQEFKLKGLTKLDLKNGDKVEAEVEGIEKGKVVIVKINDQVHALNANCTHFGAPLKNGVLTSDGRLTCPWHGGTQTP